MLGDFIKKFLKILTESLKDALDKNRIQKEFDKDYPYVMKTIDCLFRLNTNEDEVIKSLLDYYGFLENDSQHLIADYKIKKRRGLNFKYKGDFD